MEEKKKSVRRPPNIYIDTRSKSKPYFGKRKYNGIPRCTSHYSTVREAVKALVELDAKYKGKPVDYYEMTFDDAILEYLEYEKEKTRESTYKQEIKLCEHISAILGKVRINYLTINEYEEFRNSLVDKGFCPNYCNKIVLHLKAITKLMRARHNVYTYVPDGFPPFRNKEIQKEVEFYNLEEFTKYFEAIDISDHRNLKFKLMAIMLYTMGLRIGEFNALQFECVDFENKKITIKQSVDTKRKVNGNYAITPPKNRPSYRTLPIPNETFEWLLKMYRYYSKFEGFNSKWFVFGGVSPVALSTISKKNIEFAKAAGVKQIRIHGFRHSCASYLLSQTNANSTNGDDSHLSILEISKYLGHSDTQKVLNTYGHLINGLSRVKNEFDKAPIVRERYVGVEEIANYDTKIDINVT